MTKDFVNEEQPCFFLCRGRTCGICRFLPYPRSVTKSSGKVPDEKAGKITERGQLPTTPPMADLPVVAIEKAGRIEPPRDHNGDSGNDTTALGEKSKIQKVVDTLYGIVDYLESSESHLCPASDIKMTVSMQRVQDLQALAQDHFYDVASSLSRANFVFFCKVNGADLVIRMLNCLLTHPWEGLCDELQSLERSCVSLCWSLTELCVMYNHVAIQPCLVDIVTRVASQTRAKFCPHCRSESVSQDKEIKYKALLALSK